MHADSIMTTTLVTCSPDQTVGDVIALLNEKAVRMIPVVDEKRRILGAVNTMTLLSSIVPDYIVKGDLKSIPYAPDLGLLHKHYDAILDHKVSEIMDRNPTVVQARESLLSVSAALITYDRFEYALVADKSGSLVGVVATSDILRFLSKMKGEESCDA